MTTSNAVLGVFTGLLIAIAILGFSPKCWWTNKAKIVGLFFAITGVTLPVFGYIIGPAIDKADIADMKKMAKEIKDFQDKIQKSEEAACAKAGLTDPQVYWDGSNAVGHWRLNCADSSGLVHEVRTPKCHRHNPDGCR